MQAPVAVRAPDAPGRGARHIMLCCEALATSGSYFSASAYQGSVVSTLLEARDGQPSVATQSASVRASRCAVADALTKVVLATGDCAPPGTCRVWRHRFPDLMLMMTDLTTTTTGCLISFKLERSHRRSIYATGIALLLSGAAWLLLHYFLRPMSGFGEGRQSA